MKKLPTPKIYILMIVLAMIGASIACNFPDAVQVMGEAAMERCNTVSREEYVIAVESLGQIPEIPDNPENAVYEVCYRINNPAPVSARMYEGYSDEDENSEPAQGDRQPEAETRVPAGTYKGIITETEMGDRGLVEWLEDGTVVSNEVNITISADGVVTGRFVFEKVDNVSLKETSHIPPCISSNDQLFVGKASGELVGHTGQIVFDVEQTIVRQYTEGCSIGPSEQTMVYNHRQYFEVQIVNENVNGIWMYGKNVSHLEHGNPIKAQFALRLE